MPASVKACHAPIPLDDARQLTADGLELFFVSGRNGSDTQLFRVTPICS